MLNLLREHRRFFLWTTLAALLLRLFFFIYFPSITDDTRVYLDLAQNWLQHGVYGQTELGQVVPADTRLPGYSAFLAGIFWIFGAGNIRLVLLAQILLDLATCLIIADLARRTLPERRVGMVAFVLAALCPFLANYAAAVLTETLEVFFTALALDCAMAALERMSDAKSVHSPWPWWAATGASLGACILVRPDGGILLAALVLYLAALLRKSQRIKGRAASILLAGITVVVFALAPLAPWAIRNYRTLHHFQPLAPRYANESEELTPRGFNRWVKTWVADYVSVEEIYWNVPGDKIDAEKLPARALDVAKEPTLALIAEYNQSQELTPQVDARFGDLAALRIRVHPIGYYFGLPALRVADMWLRPRTELLPADIRWWEFNDDTKWSVVAVGFGLVNLFYVAAALLALIRRRAETRYLGLLVGFLLLRSAFLGTIENPEPRYTLECYPVIIVLASSLWRARP